MKKMLLINPFNYGMSNYMISKHNKEPAAIRYGILSIASYVKNKMKDEIDIKIIDYTLSKYNDYNLEDYFNHLKILLKEYAPDFVGITAMFNFLIDTEIELLHICRTSCENAIVFAGGPCSMAYAERILMEGSTDAVSFYEGEIPVLRLCSSYDYITEFNEGVSWLTLDKLKSGFQPIPEMIDDLDLIPPLNFSLLDGLEEYMHVDSIYNIGNKTLRCLPIHTSRGCPFNCVFCASHFVHGKKFRVMSPNRVISDVKRMVEEHNINCLEICDDQFLLNNSRAKEILSGLSDLKIELIAGSGVSVFAIDEEMVRLLKNAGMNTVSLAIESGSQYTLKNIIDKPVNLEEVNKILVLLKNYDIRAHAFIVVGLPGETKSLREESFEFFRKANFDWHSIACATPLKGSRLYDECVENGYIVQDSRAKDGFHRSIINTNDFTYEEISDESYLMNLELNFIKNKNLLNKNYKIAYDYFFYVSRKFPFHAFAHYCLAKSIKGLKLNHSQYEEEMKKYRDIIENDSEWMRYAKFFNIENDGI